VIQLQTYGGVVANDMPTVALPLLADVGAVYHISVDLGTKGMRTGKPLYERVSQVWLLEMPSMSYMPSMALTSTVLLHSYRS
jgi:hypothetical protein